MANILLTWELGSGIGHLMNLRPIGQELIRRGHRVVAAVRDLTRVGEVFAGTGISFVTAPTLPRFGSSDYSFDRSGYYLIYAQGGSEISEYTSPGEWLDLSKALAPSFMTATPSTDATQELIQWDTGALSQTLTFTAGTYALTFLADAGATNSSLESVTAYAGGTLIGFFTPEISPNATYQTNSFTVGSGTLTLTFQGEGGSGDYALIDDVAVISAGALARRSYAATYFDAAGRTIESVDVGTNAGAVFMPPANASQNTRSDTVLVTNYSYNAAGEVETVTDPRGLASRTLFDNLGRQTKTIANYDASVNSGNASGSFNQTTLYGYDSASHLSTQTAVMSTGTASQTTSYVYGVTTIQGSAINSNDLLRMVEYPITTGGSAGHSGTSSAYIETYTYDAAGESLTMTNRNGATHTYTHDVLGRLTQDSASTKPTITGIVHADIANSGFEDDGYGGQWTITGDAGITSDHGGNVAYLGYGGSVSQSVNIVGSTTYYLTFTADGSGSDTPTLNVNVDGDIDSPAAQITLNGSAYTTYVVAIGVNTGGSHAITFSISDDDGQFANIDDIVLTTPATGPNDPDFESTDVGGDYAFDPSSDWSFSSTAGVAADGGSFSIPGGHGGTQVAFLQTDSSSGFWDGNQGSIVLTP